MGITRADFGSASRTCSLICWRALWIFPSWTAFCTACDGATASTSGLNVCDDTPSTLGEAGAAGGATLFKCDGFACTGFECDGFAWAGFECAGLACDGGVFGDGIGWRGCGGGSGAGGAPIKRDTPGGDIRTGRLLSTAFLYLETLRNSSCEYW